MSDWPVEFTGSSCLDRQILWRWVCGWESYWLSEQHDGISLIRSSDHQTMIRVWSGSGASTGLFDESLGNRRSSLVSLLYFCTFSCEILNERIAHFPHTLSVACAAPLLQSSTFSILPHSIWTHALSSSLHCKFRSNGLRRADHRRVFRHLISDSARRQIFRKIFGWFCSQGLRNRFIYCTPSYLFFTLSGREQIPLYFRRLRWMPATHSRHTRDRASC